MSSSMLRFSVGVGGWGKCGIDFGGKVVLCGGCVVGILVLGKVFYVLYYFRVGDLWRFVGELRARLCCWVSWLWKLWQLCLCG